MKTRLYRSLTCWVVVLLTMPVLAAEPVVAYGAGSPLAENHSSWGGGPPVFDGKEWHLFVSEIAAHCGMQCWSRLSQATHAVSASPTGPFRRRGDSGAAAVPGSMPPIYASVDSRCEQKV